MKITKRICTLLIILAMLLGMVGCHTADNQEPPTTTAPSEVSPPTDSTEDTQPTAAPTKPTEPEEEYASSPILYRATDDEGNIVYLFGSIHIGTEKMYPLPDYVMNAYHESDTLAVEFDVVTASEDLEASSKAMMNMLLNDGTKTYDHISPDIYHAAASIMDHYQYPLEMLNLYKPVMWYSMIDSLTLVNAGLDKLDGIDVHLLNLAHEENKPIVDIESMESQYQMLANMSMELQEMLLESSINSYYDPLSPMHFLQMTHAWTTGDEEQIVGIITSEAEGLTAEEEKLYKEYNKAVIEDRNLLMAQYAKDALASEKTVFICVGAAHIVGPGALVDLLTQDGYTLERIWE